MAAGATQHLQAVTPTRMKMRHKRPAALPTYNGRSSSVICQAPTLSVNGGSGVDGAGRSRLVGVASVDGDDEGAGGVDDEEGIGGASVAS